MLPPEPHAPREVQDEDGWSDEEDGNDPSADWPELHISIRDTIAALGGRVHPKLNWSAPKDATWIAATNSMECMTPNDIYLLLKSSDFITHDLDQAFDGCVDDANGSHSSEPLPQSDGAASRPSLAGWIPYHLVLRKSIRALITSMEFRCFVRGRRLLGICQRELKHYEFMPSIEPILRTLISDFFQNKLRHTFPDENFVFDVYVPRPKPDGRVWLIDINPWAPRTDPLLFSWLELLERPDPLASPNDIVDRVNEVEEGVVRLQLNRDGHQADGNGVAHPTMLDEEVEEIDSLEFRTVQRDDPENYSFNTSLYSAHKLPLDVVAAGMDGGGIRDFLSRWNSETGTANARAASDDDSSNE